jgi:integrase
MDRFRKNNDLPPRTCRRLTDGDVRRIVRALAGAGSRTRAVVLLALATGARGSELQQLRWDDIDLWGGVIRFRGGKRGGYAVQLVPGLAPALADHRIRQRRKGSRMYGPLENPYVFAGQAGSPLPVEAIAQLFARHTQAACGQGFALHTARWWACRRRRRSH